MSIAADIERVTITREGHARLELTGRLYRTPGGAVFDTPPGQPSLTILDPTWIPEAGLGIWGGSDSVIIEAPISRNYKRIGYTELREDF